MERLCIDLRWLSYFCPCFCFILFCLFVFIFVFVFVFLLSVDFQFCGTEETPGAILQSQIYENKDIYAIKSNTCMIMWMWTLCLIAPFPMIPHLIYLQVLWIQSLHISYFSSSFSFLLFLLRSQYLRWKSRKSSNICSPASTLCFYSTFHTSLSD